MDRYEETFYESGLYKEGSYVAPPMGGKLDERYGQGGWYVRTRVPETVDERLAQNMGFEIYDVYVTSEGVDYAQQHPPEDTGQ